MKHKECLTKYFDIVCKKCKSKKVLVGIFDDMIKTNCCNCNNEFVSESPQPKS